MIQIARSLAAILSGWVPPAVAVAAVFVPWPELHLPAVGRLSTPLALAGAMLAFSWTLAFVIRHSSILTEHVLIVGRGPLVDRLITELAQRRDRRYFVVGVLDGLRSQDGDASGPLGHIEEMIDLVKPHRIVIAGERRCRRIPARCLLDWRLRGVAVEEAVTFYERVTGKLAIEALRASTLALGDGFLHSDFVPSDLSRAVSRLISLVVATLGLVLLSPLFAIIALAIKLDTPGPVLFRHQRVTCGGRPFALVKFRTMREGGITSQWVRDNAFRITRVGRWLRRFRLDELPQLVNVFRGEMNLVGPRPHPESNYELFIKHIPFYWLRASVRPGITGWAQVRYGYANSLEEETEKMRYDLFYIKHRSLSLDLRILLSTVGVLLFDRRSHESVPAVAPRARRMRRHWTQSPTGVTPR
jgi:exopolysaccharide biosynthesis polyprenyl glycosylphosphotransferase